MVNNIPTGSSRINYFDAHQMTDHHLGSFPTPETRSRPSGPSSHS